MKKLVIGISILLILNCIVYAEEFSFRPLIRNTFPPSNFIEKNQIAYFMQYSGDNYPFILYSYDLSNDSVKSLYSFDDNLSALLDDFYEDDLIIRKYYISDEKYGEARVIKRKGLRYNLKRKQLETDEIVNKLISLFGNNYIHTFYYQNYIFYIQASARDYSTDMGNKKSEVKIYDYNTGTTTDIIIAGVIMDVAPDKQHLLFYDEEKHRILIYNLDKREFLNNFDLPFRARGSFFGWSVQFLTSNIFLMRSLEDIEKAEYGNYFLIDIEKPQEKIPVSFYTLSAPMFEDKPVPYIFFFSTLKKAFSEIYYKQKSYTEYVVLDTAHFYDFLVEQGLIFIPRKGVVNDNHVRVRQNPNLQARTLTAFAKGTAVEAFERSGTKTTIGSSTAYWYKVKQKEGSEGWVYGVYLDLEKLNPASTSTPVPTARIY